MSAPPGDRFLFGLTGSGLQRLSCLACDRAAVRQPYMSSDQWLDALIKFERHHRESCYRGEVRT